MIRPRIDARELDAFRKSIGRAAASFDDFLRSFMTEQAERVITETMRRTPVKTGTLQKGWRLGEVRVSGEVVEAEIVNPIEYASFIEYGHRIVRGGKEVGWYDGRFMCKISMDLVRKMMPARFARDFERWARREGIA